VYRRLHKVGAVIHPGERSEELMGFLLDLYRNPDKRRAIGHRLSGAVPARFAGGVLVGFGGLFFLRSLGQGVAALTGQTALGGSTLGVLVADCVTTPVWVAGGVLLWRRQALGYSAGAGLLFQASLLIIGLLVFFILQPFLTATPFPVQDFVVIFVMGLVCFLPLALFSRGIIIKG
jgi:hypothetical protein